MEKEDKKLVLDYLVAHKNNLWMGVIILSGGLAGILLTFTYSWAFLFLSKGMFRHNADPMSHVGLSKDIAVSIKEINFSFNNKFVTNLGFVERSGTRDTAAMPSVQIKGNVGEKQFCVSTGLNPSVKKYGINDMPNPLNQVNEKEFDSKAAIGRLQSNLIIDLIEDDDDALARLIKSVSS